MQEAQQLSNTVDAGQLAYQDCGQKHLARVALYTREMLRRPPTSYVESADTAREVTHQAVQEHSQTAGPGSFDTPQASGERSPISMPYQIMSVSPTSRIQPCMLSQVVDHATVALLSTAC